MSNEARSSFDASIPGARFHSIGRASSRSRATVEVEVIGGSATILVEIGLGEPGAEQCVLQITSPGRTPLPGFLEAGQLISVRFPNGIPADVQKINTTIWPERGPNP